MGIFLGQLPPAEIARFKAELAETLIANFCYPRFFDPRTQSLRMRPVDRAKRQEVWLYLSSVDFTAWGRVDLTSPDFQHQIERLFILFVQRNRSFFGEQGRRRMSDIRMLIGSCAASVAQGLRSHLMGQKQGRQPFGSPRPVVSWSASNVGGRAELTWEQIANATILLQQQLLEVRGEGRPALPPANDGRQASSTTRRPPVPTRPQGTGSGENEYASRSLPPAAPSPSSGQQSAVRPSPVPAARYGSSTQSKPVPQPAVASTNGNGVSTVKEAPLPATPRKSQPLATQASLAVEAQDTSALPLKAMRENENGGARTLPPPLVEKGSAPVPVVSTSAQQRNIPPSTPSPSLASGQRDTTALAVGEDDIAIFDQMRHQLIVWLRIEAVTAGLEISGQGPSQLLERLRQQGRLDETRLQVVSTLLNLSNQVIKTGMVSMIDYKQALMFHLMHTRR
jgi:hypothetical protein